MDSIQVDIVIVGAGVVGLWLLNVLSQQGYQCVLLEKTAVGAGQTIRSQGIIHGGTKYALSGKLSQAAWSIADMPAQWQACLAGEGQIDLSAVKVLSQQHFMWSYGKYTSALKNFIASKALQSHSDVLKLGDYPAFFQQPEFVGSLCALNETVLDVPSLLSVLAAPYRDRILLGEVSLTEQGLQLNHAGSTLSIHAERTLVTAGEGAQALCANLPDMPVMQRRPLHMVWARFPEYDPVKHIFVHCVVSGGKPEFTITSHQDDQGNTVWYIGGEIAESGTQRDAQTQIAHTRAILNRYLPWVDLGHVKWGAEVIARAEGAQSGGKRPDYFCLYPTQHAMVIWPTKLALTPAILGSVQDYLADVQPRGSIPTVQWPTAPIAEPLWYQ